MDKISITPKGNPLSLLATASTLTFTSLSFKILVTSFPFKAYLNLFFNIMAKGIHYLNLWGP